MQDLDEPARRGVVLAYVPGDGSHASQHELATLGGVARRLAALKGYSFGGFYRPSARPSAPVYFVPSTTLDTEQAHALGIHGPHDLFGGVVPHAFVGTKAISHPLVQPDAQALPGWNPDFSARAGDAVLRGFTVFTHDAARQAARQLLQSTAVRLKSVCATGGHGQAVARDAREFETLLNDIDAQELSAHGLVLEQDLDEVQTFSVGQVSVDDLTASYFGVQRLTRNNRGQEVFGGSDLSAVRGDFDELLTFAQQPPQIVRAVQRARRYDAAVRACYAGFFASRSNYDVALGRDAQGQWCCGVLEQSWRVGGATGAEIAALELLRAQPERTQVRASTFEVFGESPEPPPQATVYYRGTDPQVGPLTKYTLVQEDGHTG